MRGGSSNYNLVEINGIPINSFYYGGLLDFSQITSDFVSEIDVARGPQSAMNGSYAMGSVVNFDHEIAGERAGARYGCGRRDTFREPVSRSAVRC